MSKSNHLAKEASRFLAVQALYSAMFIEYDGYEQLKCFLSEIVEFFDLVPPDHLFTQSLYLQAQENNEEIEETIVNHLADNWTMERVDSVSIAIIKTAVAEIKYFDTPPIVIVNEYTNIASILLDESDLVSFINAILDKISLQIISDPEQSDSNPTCLPHLNNQNTSLTEDQMQSDIMLNTHDD